MYVQPHAASASAYSLQCPNAQHYLTFNMLFTCCTPSFCRRQ